MSNIRTSTDLLLSMEKDINTLERRVKNIEGLLKILLQKLNSGSLQNQQKADQKQPVNPQDVFINKDNFENRPKTDRFSEIASSHGIAIDDTPSENPFSMKEADTRGRSRLQREKTKDKRPTVSQSIMISDSPLFLASIEIFDQGGVLVNQARTNQNGKWRMMLDPGDYMVHVLKRFPPDSGKKSIDVTYDLNIPYSKKKIIELDTFSLNV